MKVFLSYTRIKNEFNAVSAFRHHLVHELSLLVPGSTVFQDTESIGVGEDYPDKTAQELAASDLLLVLLSPAWLHSPWCRQEFTSFTAKELQDGRRPRVLPLLWVRTPSLDAPGDDAIAKDLARIQYADWRELRHENWENPAIRRQVAKLAERAVAIAAQEASHTSSHQTDKRRKVGLVATFVVLMSGLLAILGWLMLPKDIHRGSVQLQAESPKTSGKEDQVREGGAVGSRPELRLKTLDGHTLGPADFPGQVVLVHFWATWCGPCQLQARILEPLHGDFKAQGVQFLAADVGEDEGTVKGFLQKSPLPCLGSQIKWTGLFEFCVTCLRAPSGREILLFPYLEFFQLFLGRLGPALPRW